MVMLVVICSGVFVVYDLESNLWNEGIIRDFYFRQFSRMNSLHVQTRVHSLVCSTAKSLKKSQLGVLLPWENSVKLYQNKDRYRRICIY